MPASIDGRDATTRIVPIGRVSKSELRHRHLHHRAFEKLGAQPELRAPCLALVDDWIARPEHGHADPWLQEWRRMLADWSIDRIAAVVLDPERGQTLRRCSPLGPALTPRERWTALAEVNRDIETSAGDHPPA
jgi:hypothetical protein